MASRSLASNASGQLEQAARATISGVFLKAEPGEVVPPQQQSLAEQVVMLGACPTSRHLVVALEHLRDRLGSQFRNEESGAGLFEEILVVAPWLEPRVDHLRREHDHLLALCERLAEDVRQRPRRATVHAVFEVLIHCLREHDDSEHALAQEALNAESGEAF